MDDRSFRFSEHTLTGTVIHGLKNGRKFGFPTINIQLDDTCQFDDTGVFAVTILLRNKKYQGMLYVGTRPTLRLQNKSLEINIFDFDEDCYDEKVRFNILKKIRPEINFESIDLLLNQIRKDKDEILQLFNN